MVRKIAQEAVSLGSDEYDRVEITGEIEKALLVAAEALDFERAALLRDRLLRQGLDRLEREKGRLEELSARIAERQADPYALADELARQLEE